MQQALGYASMGAVVVLALIGAYTDVRFGKIFNVVTVPFALLGLALHAIGGGWQGLLLRRRMLGASFRSLGTSLYMRAAMSTPMEIADGAGSVRLPYAIALGAGALLALALKVPW